MASEHYDLDPDGDAILICLEAIKEGTAPNDGDATRFLQEEVSEQAPSEDSVVR